MAWGGQRCPANGIWQTGSGYLAKGRQGTGGIGVMPPALAWPGLQPPEADAASSRRVQSLAIRGRRRICVAANAASRALSDPEAEWMG